MDEWGGIANTYGLIGLLLLILGLGVLLMLFLAGERSAFREVYSRLCRLEKMASMVNVQLKPDPDEEEWNCYSGDDEHLMLISAIVGRYGKEEE